MQASLIMDSNTWVCFGMLSFCKFKLSPHLLPENLKNIQKIKFVKNDYLEDGALHLLSSYELPSLKHLELKSCYEVTDKGVLSLTNLK